MVEVLDVVRAWAETAFEREEGFPFLHGDQLLELANHKLPAYSGTSEHRWLFLYSPNSAAKLIEVNFSLGHFVATAAMCRSISDSGGMLIAADFSKCWGTPECDGEIKPLAVIKPIANYASGSLRAIAGHEAPYDDPEDDLADTPTTAIA